MSGRPELLVIGHVTEDHFGAGQTRMGGAASYAARAAATLGIRTALITGAPPDWPLLRELQQLPQLELHVLPRSVVTTFALDYSGPVRRLRCTSAAVPIVPEEIPTAWRDCPVTYLAAVAGECPGSLAECLGSAFVGAGLQGWMRRIEADGSVQASLGPEMASPPANLDAGVLSVEDHPQAAELATRLADQGVTVALTDGARGCRVFAGTASPVAVPASPADEHDPTGAGDVFGVAFTLALARGRAVEDAARIAAQIAARVVEGPGLGRLPAFSPDLATSLAPHGVGR